jgi:superfamily II DNA or RNA helicase
MALPDEDIFQLFRREAPVEREASPRVDLAFRILPGDRGATLEVVDRRKKQPVSPSYLLYAGPERQVLRTLEQIRERNSFVIDWEGIDAGVSLVEHPYLMRALRDCPHVTDPDGHLLKFASEPGELRLHILAESDDLFRCEVRLHQNEHAFDQIICINEDYILAGNNLVEVSAMGPHFHLLPHFNVLVTKANLSLFLSLVHSHLDTIHSRMEGFQIHRNHTRSIALTPCLIFEKIDELNHLYLRVGQQLPDIDFQSLQDYELARYAEIRHEEQTIRIRTIEPRPLEEAVKNIQQLLRQHQPKGQKDKVEQAVLIQNQFMIPEKIATEFIHRTLPSLLDSHVIYGAKKLKAYQVYTPLPKVTARLEHGLNFLEGDVSLEFDGEIIPLFEALRQYHKNAYIKLSDGRHALLNQQYVKRLERIFRKKGKVARISIFDLPLAEELIQDSATDKVFQASRKLYEGFNRLKVDKGRIPKVNATLRPYQRQGYRWLRYLHDQELGGCLADDMGLGKTLQTITLLAGIYPAEARPSLIVMPRSLLFNWRKEVERFAPKLRIYTFYGPDRDIKAIRDAQLVFTTYATMRNEIDALRKLPFYYVVLDESQNIKNIQSQTSRAAMMLKCTHRLALSGTPVENNLGELFTLFQFLNPSMFGTETQFNQDYLNPIQKHQDPDAAYQLRRKIYPFILRRLKKDVLLELPDKSEQILYVEMDDAQRRLYEQRRQYYASAIQAQISEKGIRGAQFFILQALSELRQIASIPETLTGKAVKSAKLEMLQEQLADTLANGHKVLIFVQFLGAIESISERLEADGIGFVSMTGATRDRQRLVKQFQEDPECRVFLMTLKTGGVGLNLTAADTIFIYDPWWNVAAENQAIDRAHRMGQINKVMAYKLIASGTIEEKMLQLQLLKKELFDSVISDDSIGPKALSEEDIQMLLA